jgi:peptidyl-prolyl cis-trans isomerase D
MLRDIRRLSSNWLGKIVMWAVMGILSISFAVWGIGDIFRGFGQSTFATIGNTDISIEQFRQLYTERLQQIGRQIGRPLTPDQARAFGVDRQVLQQVVGETALDEEAKRLGLAQSNDDVVRKISRDPSFQGPGGSFDPARFAQIIRQAGFTEQRYVAEQRNAALRGQITGTITAGTAPSATLTEAIDRFQNEQRSIAYIRLGAAQAGTIAAATPEALQTYFNDNKPLFRAPEYRKIALVTVTPDSIAKWTEVSDADARKAFESEKDKYTKPERREVSQIVFPNADEARAARERLTAGASFADIAKERGLTAADVDLGLIARTDIVDPAVANAAFTLPVNEVSEPIAGTFGTALIKVTKIEAGTVANYDAVAGEIKHAIALDRARASVEDIRNKMEDERGGGANVAEAAKKLGLTATVIEAMDRSGRGPDGQPVSGLPQDADIVAEAFESDVGVETDPAAYKGGYIWFEVLGVTPSRERSFDEVKSEIETRWHADQVASALRSKAEELVGKINGGATLADVAHTDGLKVETADTFKRTDTVAGLSAAAVRAVFRTAKGAAGEAESENGERIVFQVNDIVTPAFDANAEATRTLKEMLRRMIDDEQINAHLAKLRNDLGVTINQAAFAQITGANN